LLKISGQKGRPLDAPSKHGMARANLTKTEQLRLLPGQGPQSISARREWLEQALRGMTRALRNKMWKSLDSVWI